MICGDLVFTYKDNIQNSKIYVAYDRNLAVGSTLFGVNLVTLKQFQLMKIKMEILQPRLEISYAKRKKLAEHLLNIINKKIYLSISERLNFDKYINWLYSDLLKINLLDHPSIKVTPQNLYESKELINERLPMHINR